MIRLLLLTIAALIAGCVAGPPPLATPPADFVIDAAVVGEVDPGEIGDATLASAWAGHRYILFADGTLHHDIGEPTASGHVPPPRRALTRREMTELWQIVEDVNLTDPAAAGRLDSLQAADAGEMPAVVVLIGGQGQWWSHWQRLGPADPEAGPPAMRLIRRLAELAWAGSLDRRAVVTPRRYDFGPDPYARFR